MSASAWPQKAHAGDVTLPAFQSLYGDQRSPVWIETMSDFAGWNRL